MLRSLDSSSENFLNNLNNIAARMERAQREISTGRRVQSVSDDPEQVSPLLQTRADLAAAVQIQSNPGRVKIDLAQANPISLSGRLGNRRNPATERVAVPLTKTAQDIFDSPDPATNVFRAVNNLRIALQNNDQAAIEAAQPRPTQTRNCRFMARCRTRSPARWNSATSCSFS